MTTNPTRRHVLIAAASNAVWFSVGCAPYQRAALGPGFSAWAPDPLEKRPERLAVEAAILAASPHNTQPWRFKVTSEAIEVYADRTRSLGAMDSLERELFIGLGCAIENAVLAAEAHGRAVEVAYLPDPGAPSLAARLTLRPAGPTVDPLHAAVGERRTNRFRYHDRPVPAPTLATVSRQLKDPQVRAIWVTLDEPKARLRQDCIDSVTAITRDTEMAQASHRWWRQTPAEVEQHRDGLNLDGLGLSDTVRWFAGRQDTVELEEANRYWVDSVVTRHTTGAGYFMLVSDDRGSVEQQLLTGRAFQRLALALHLEGVSVQPLNMLPELQDREQTTGAAARPFTARAEAWLKPLGGGLQLLARFGYAERPGFHSPRRPAAEVIGD